jgi:hypothetical protein
MNANCNLGYNANIHNMEIRKRIATGGKAWAGCNTTTKTVTVMYMSTIATHEYAG